MSRECTTFRQLWTDELTITDLMLAAPSWVMCVVCSLLTPADVQNNPPPLPPSSPCLCNVTLIWKRLSSHSPDYWYASSQCAVLQSGMGSHSLSPPLPPSRCVFPALVHCPPPLHPSTPSHAPPQSPMQATHPVHDANICIAICHPVIVDCQFGKKAGPLQACVRVGVVTGFVGPGNRLHHNMST